VAAPCHLAPVHALTVPARSCALSVVQDLIANKARFQQPLPLQWDADTPPDQGGPSSSSSTGGGSGGDLLWGSRPAAPFGNRGPAASTSGGSGRYSSSIQAFDDCMAAESSGDALAAVPVPYSGEVAHTQQQQQQQQQQHLKGGGMAAAPASIPSAGSSYGASSAATDALWAAAVAHVRDHALRAPAAAADLLGAGGSASSAAGARPGLWQHLGEVYVLLFGVGQKDTEGIYSLRAVSDEGLPTETIIAFEDMEDAVRYAALLEATMDHSPAVCSIPPSELAAFCADSGYRCRLELEGSMLMPPDYNVHVTDWERSLRLREGRFAVLPEEPDVDAAAAAAAAAAGGGSDASSSSSSSSRAAAGALVGSEGVYSPWLQQSGAAAPEYSPAQLDSLKAQLEALLPDTPAAGDGHDARGSDGDWLPPDMAV
jgi:hypothetical protein